jgi:hypothetical protein
VRKGWWRRLRKAWVEADTEAEMSWREFEASAVESSAIEASTNGPLDFKDLTLYFNSDSIQIHPKLHWRHQTGKCFDLQQASLSFHNLIQSLPEAPQKLLFNLQSFNFPFIQPPSTPNNIATAIKPIKTRNFNIFIRPRLLFSLRRLHKQFHSFVYSPSFFCLVIPKLNLNPKLLRPFGDYKFTWKVPSLNW